MKLPIGVGELIAGKYRVERILGIGGMGVVVAATHVGLGELRAVKLMLPQVAENAELCARFLREAQAVARLRGEHLARVHDVGQLEDGVPYMVIEYVEGKEIAAVLRNRGPLPVEEAALYALQTCEALAEAHRHGIVHRDIKPQNLFLSTGTDGAPSIKVLDFGVAKTADDLTMTGVLLGSPRYMSPEQVRASHTVDARADLWSVGVVLYEMLTGVVPFDAPGQILIFTLIAERAAAAPSSHRPELPAALDAVVLRCLEKDRDHRYPDVAALAAALGPFAAPEARALPARVARVLGVEPEPPPTPPVLPGPLAGEARPPGTVGKHIVARTVPLPMAMPGAAGGASEATPGPSARASEAMPGPSARPPEAMPGPGVDTITTMGGGTSAPSRRTWSERAAPPWLVAAVAGPLVVAAIAVAGLRYRRQAQGRGLDLSPSDAPALSAPGPAEVAPPAGSGPEVTPALPDGGALAEAPASARPAAEPEKKGAEPKRPARPPRKPPPQPGLPSSRNNF
jgi:serine/threonine-protein kinase